MGQSRGKLDTQGTKAVLNDHQSMGISGIGDQKRYMPKFTPESR
jgi:hypothetical protein